MTDAVRKQEFANFIVEMMGDWAPVQAKRMFGGFGLFRDGLMFAIILGDGLYFKVDDATQARFEAEGLKPFQYASKGRTTSLRYHEAPAVVYDDPQAMAHWAALAYESAVRQQGRKATTGKRRPPVSGLRNLGPKSQAMLEQAGIQSEDELRRVGAVVAYARTKAVCPHASLNLLWALEGALTGRDWREVAEADRATLLMALEDVQRHLL